MRGDFSITTKIQNIGINLWSEPCKQHVLRTQDVEQLRLNLGLSEVVPRAVPQIPRALEMRPSIAKTWATVRLAVVTRVHVHHTRAYYMSRVNDHGVTYGLEEDPACAV